MPEALPAVTVPSFEKAGRSFATASIVVPGPDVLVLVDDDVALAARDGHGDDLVLELAALLRSLGLVLRGDRELVLLLAGKLPALRHVLGGGAHVVTVEGVQQSVLQHRVDELEVAHLGAAAHIGGVRRLRHRFLAARDDDVGVAVGDLLHADGDRAQARAAELVQPPGCLLLRDARRHRGLAGRVLALAGSEDLPEDDLVDLAGVDLRTLERRLDRHRPELVRRGVGEGAVERADRGAGRTNDHNVTSGHVNLLFEKPWLKPRSRCNDQSLGPREVKLSLTRKPHLHAKPVLALFGVFCAN